MTTTQTLNRNSTTSLLLDLVHVLNFPASLGSTPNKKYCYIKDGITLICDSLSITAHPSNRFGRYVFQIHIVHDLISRPKEGIKLHHVMIVHRSVRNTQYPFHTGKQVFGTLITGFRSFC